MVAIKLMYGCGALSWYQHECDDFGIEVWLRQHANKNSGLFCFVSIYSQCAEYLINPNP